MKALALMLAAASLASGGAAAAHPATPSPPYVSSTPWSRTRLRRDQHGAAGMRRMAAFTSDNIVVLAVGDGSTTMVANTAYRVELQEHALNAGRTGTSLVQTIPLASTAADLGNNNVTFTLPGSSATDNHGQLELSQDGMSIMAVGYNVTSGSGGFTGTSVRRVVAALTGDGVVDYTPFSTGSGTYTVSAVASDNGNRFWFSTSAGSFYLPPGAAGPTTIYQSPTYTGICVANSQLYIHRNGGRQVHTYPAALPTSTQSQHNQMGNPTFNDPRGAVWRSATEFWIVDQGVGLYRMTRPSSTSTSWSRSNAFQAGPSNNVNQFLDVALSRDGNTLLVVTASALYTFNVSSTAWLNGGQPIAAPAGNTVFKGVALAPAAPPTPTATATATATISGTPTATGTSTSTAGTSSTPTSTSTATGTASASTSAAPIDLEGLARQAAANAAAKANETNMIVGVAAGGGLLVAVLGYFGLQYKERKSREWRLRKMQQVEAKRGTGSSSGSMMPVAPLPGTSANVVMYQVNMVRPPSGAAQALPSHLAQAGSYKSKTGHGPVAAGGGKGGRH